ncbi:MAG: diguanylate cyclase [Magnetococcales bacterium]|nr:diguanylate cyclase [Magnetococcales bacterium]
MSAIGWFSFRVTEQAVVSSAISHMWHVVDTTQHHTEAFHDRAKLAMTLAMENPIFKEYFSLPETRSGNQFDASKVLNLSPAQRAIREQIDRWTFSLQRRLPIGETCLIDRSGQEHSRITRGKVAPDEELSPSESGSVFFEPSFRLQPGEVHVTPPYMSGDVKQWVFAYTSPVALDDGTTPAFYHFEIPVIYFQEVLREDRKQVSLSTEKQLDRMFIITPSGRIMADSTHAISLEQLSSEPEGGPHDLAHYLPTVSSVSSSKEFLAIMDKTRQATEGMGTFEENGHTNYVVFKRLPLFDWSLVIVKSYDRLLDGSSSLNFIRFLIFGIGIAILLLGVPVIWFLARHITRPLTQISAAMQRMETGDLFQEVPVAGVDELSVMARVFNHMSATIRKNSMELYQEKNKLTTIIHSAREAILVSNEHERVVLVNPEAERLLDKTAGQIIEEGFLNLVDDPAYVKEFLNRQGIDMPETLVYKNRILNFFAATIKNDVGANIGSAALIRDVTAEKKLEEKLRQLSFTDELTGLSNRRWMEEVLAKEFARARRYALELSVLFFDVDFFKKFNDKYGHDMGDKVLRTIGKIAKIGFRNTDLPCRYGGEEFCVILPNTGPEGAMVAAEHFRKDVESLRVDNLQVTVTIGAASLFSGEFEDPGALLKAADSALYEGKREGRNRVIIFKSASMDKMGAI